MTPSGQRAVPVKKRGSTLAPPRTLAVAACLLVILPGVARGQDGGTDVPLKPKVIEYANGTRCLNQPAWVLVDGEMTRLQQVEEKHKNESWMGVLVTGGVVGLLVGVAAGFAIGFSIPRK